MAQTCVYTESPERKHSQIEFLHLKLVPCTNGKKKKKKVANASFSGFNFWQTEVHRNCLLVVAAVLLGLAYITGVYATPLPSLACSVISLAWSFHSAFIKLICI